MRPKDHRAPRASPKGPSWDPFFSSFSANRSFWQLSLANPATFTICFFILFIVFSMLFVGFFCFYTKFGQKTRPRKTHWPPDKNLASGGRAGAKFLSWGLFFFPAPVFLIKFYIKTYKNKQKPIKSMDKPLKSMEKPIK